MAWTKKPGSLYLNKADAISKAQTRPQARRAETCGHKVLSGVTGEGITSVLRAMAEEINERRAARAEEFVDAHTTMPAPAHSKTRRR